MAKNTCKHQDDAPLVIPPAKTSKSTSGDSMDVEGITATNLEDKFDNPPPSTTPKKKKGVSISGVIKQTPDGSTTKSKASKKSALKHTEALLGGLHDAGLDDEKGEVEEDDEMEVGEEDEYAEDDTVEVVMAPPKIKTKKQKKKKASSTITMTKKNKSKSKTKTKSAPDPTLEYLYTQYFNFTLHIPPCPNTVNASHGICATMFQIMLAANPTFTLHPVGHGAKNISLISTGDALPATHKPLKKEYFSYTGENKQWNNMIRDCPRKIFGVLLMSTHKDPKTLVVVDNLYADLFSAGFEMAYKACQALVTTNPFILLYVPNIFHPE